MEIKVEGLAETFELLKQAPKNIVAQGFRRSLQAAGNVIGAEVANRALKITKTGELLSNLRVQVTLDSQFRGGEVDINFGKEGYKAAWVEFGHRMVGHKPELEQVGEVAPHPFMRPAADACAKRAVDAFEAELTAVVVEEYGI